MIGLFCGWYGPDRIPEIDFRPDIVSRGPGAREWLALGKRPLVATGGRHAGYEFVHGEWDGREHPEVVQQAKRRDIAWESSGLTWARVPCGTRVEITDPAPTTFGAYYMVPTEDFVRFQAEQLVKDLPDAAFGVEFDEPEFFHRAGHSPAFKEEWRRFYGEEWVDPESGCDARFRAEQLKSFLFTRQVRTLFRAAKAKNPGYFCMVNPHSPLNYAEMFSVRSIEAGITSMQGALVGVPEVDGVLGEVWSDTIRAPIIYLGHPSVEPFFHSYLERSYFRGLCLDSPRRLIHLLDPKSDDPKYPWVVYRRWFEEDTVAAWLLGAQHFMVAWPERLYVGDEPPAGPAPDEYKTAFTAFMSVCRELERHPYEHLSGIGVPITDTVMWQRGRPGRGYLDALYALSLPLLDHGIDAQITPLERADEPGFLEKYRVLLCSFDFWQPQARSYADSLVRWVKDSGTLLYFGTSEFDDVPSAWWRRAGNDSSFAYLMRNLGVVDGGPVAGPLEPVDVLLPADSGLPSRLFDAPDAPPREPSMRHPHLYEPARLLHGKPDGAEALLKTQNASTIAWHKPCGNGHLIYVGISAWHLAYGAEGAELVRAFCRYACMRSGIRYEEKPALDVQRGPFRFAYAVSAHTIDGTYLDLTDHRLATLTDPAVRAREHAVLYRLPDTATEPTVLFSSGQCVVTTRSRHKITVEAEGPLGTILVSAFLLPGGPPADVSAIDVGTGATALVWRSYEPESRIQRVAHRGTEGKVVLTIAYSADAP